MEFIYNDGGRSQYFKGKCGDCVVRAICNATGKDYKEVYNRLNELAINEKTGCKKKGKSNSRNGVYKRTIKKYLEGELNLKWISCMSIGSGCQVHLSTEELPKNKSLILSLSRHLTCVKNGVLYDTYDCSREGNRCVYGYWIAK